MEDNHVGNNHRERHKILRVALDLFSRRGFYGTSMTNIADACNIQKSSIYDYYRTKCDVALAAINIAFEECDKIIFNAYVDNKIPIKQQIDNFFDKLKDYFKNNSTDFSAILLLALELRCNGYYRIYRKINEYFEGWRLAFFHLLTQYGSKAYSERLINCCFVQFLGICCSHYLETTDDQKNFQADWDNLATYCYQQDSYHNAQE